MAEPLPRIFLMLETNPGGVDAPTTTGRQRLAKRRAQKGGKAPPDPVRVGLLKVQQDRVAPQLPRWPAAFLKTTPGLASDQTAPLEGTVTL